VQRIDLGSFETLPQWLSLLTEAFAQAGIRAIRVQTCAVCMEMPASLDPHAVLANLKRTLDGI
jgi:hypothetical protein